MGHSLEEIAAITECPVGTVKARMFHAREKLRLFLPTLGRCGERMVSEKRMTTPETGTPEHPEISALIPWYVNGSYRRP